MRPRHVFFSIFVLLSVLIASVGAYAQGFDPPEPPDRPESVVRRVDDDPFYLNGGGAGLSPQPDLPGTTAHVMGPEIDPGKSGISYRYIMTYGISESPYLADNQHLEDPWALAVDSDDKVYLLDHMGSRLHKYHANGGHTWEIGIPGMHYITEDTVSFSWPRDVAVDGNNNVWVADHERVTQYDKTGTFKQIFPSWENKPWNCGNDNGHFCQPAGLAFDSFDSSDWMYVSDSDNHRVQVFKFSGDDPVYSTTIGITGNPGSGSNQFDYPGQTVVDGNNNLFVADKENARIQKCVYNSGLDKWECSTFHGTGDWGEGDDELDYVEGLGILGNILYIADSGNGRIKKCDVTEPVDPCDNFIEDLRYPLDVTAITTDRILISQSDFTVREYNGSGEYQSIFAGKEGVPYKTDNERLNRPWGVTVGLDNSLYVMENHGHRLVKMNQSGKQLNTAWPIGEPGIRDNDNYHFNSSRGNLAVDSLGQIYVPDSRKHRVQVYDPQGNHKYTMGVTGDRGDDNSHFNRPAGVAISPVNGDIYVADRRNYRVQIFDNKYKYKDTLGDTGNPGDGKYQFDEPYGVFVVINGDIYVTDRYNHRVQIYDKNLKWKATLGKTGECEWDFGYLCAPQSIAINKEGHIFVTEGWNNRVTGFDKDYKYLTTVGGEWGNKTSGFRDAAGIAFDNSGNLFVSDPTNHRVQKFSPIVFGWRQSNLDGFLDIENTAILSLKSLNDALVAGTWNRDFGAQLWKMEHAKWVSLMTGGFDNPENDGIGCLEKFKNKYYAGTSSTDTNGGEIWRSDNLTNWNRVVKDGFGDTTNAEVWQMIVYKDMLYASTWSYTSAHGAEIWRSDSGNASSWTQVASNGFGDSENQGIQSLTNHNNMLYASTVNYSTGAEVWRSSDGKGWKQVNQDGFGDKYNRRNYLASYMDYLYVGTYNFRDSSDPGGELWRCKKCDGSDWKQVPIQKGFGDVDNLRIIPVGVPGNSVYAFTENNTSGIQIWIAPDGEQFTKVGPDGFGDSSNYYPLALTQTNKKLFVGTGNWANGAEVWMRENFYYLPNILKE